MPAPADCSPILLYCSAACFTSSMVGCRGPSRLAPSSVLVPESFAQLILSEGFCLSSAIEKLELSHVNAEIAQDFAQLRAFVLGEAGETRIGVAHWRAQLNR